MRWARTRRRLVVDVRMPRMDGITATKRLRALPHPPKVITLTTFDLDEYVYEALAAGADGFLLKDTDPAEILRAVHLVAAGSAMLHPTAARRLIDRCHHTSRPQATRAQTRIDALTPRERDVLALVAQGDTNADTAKTLRTRPRRRLGWPALPPSHPRTCAAPGRRTGHRLRRAGPAVTDG